MFGNVYTQSQQASTSYRQLALVLLTTTRSSAPETTANINNNKIKVFYFRHRYEWPERGRDMTLRMCAK